MSWSEVETIANNGSAELYFNNDDTTVAEHNCMKNGCTIDVVVNYGSITETGEAHIVGFNHDALADGSGTAAITFSFVDALAVRSKWNSNGDSEGGWEASEVRATMSAWTLQDTNGNAINVASVIKSTYDRYTINGDIYTSTTDTLWLFSEKEICGYTFDYENNTLTMVDGTRFVYSRPDVYSAQYEYYQYFWPDRVANTTWNRQGEGNKPGSLFDDSIPSLYKTEGLGGSSAASWWLRSSSYGSSEMVCYVTSDGRTGSCFDHCDLTWAECIVPGFCIGE